MEVLEIRGGSLALAHAWEKPIVCTMAAIIVSYLPSY